MIVDAHMHMEEAYPAEILKEQDIACIANAATPEEYKNLRKLQDRNPSLWISAGIHPWKVDEVHWDAMLPILEEVDIIGEIGRKHLNICVAMKTGIWCTGIPVMHGCRSILIWAAGLPSVLRCPSMKRYSMWQPVSHWIECWWKRMVFPHVRGVRIVRSHQRSMEPY